MPMGLPAKAQDPSKAATPHADTRSSRAVKTFVIDTNVLIHDPESLFTFAHSKVVLPLAVVEELDSFKRMNDDRGYAVRQVIRKLDRLREKGKLSQGVTLDHGGTLVIEYRRAEKLPPEFESQTAKDNQILATALYLKEKGENVVFISKDMNLRIKAEVLGLETEDYEREKVPIRDLYKGWREVQVEQALIDKFFAEKKLDSLPWMADLFPNEFVILKPMEGGSASALARFKPLVGLVPLFSAQAKPWGVKPLNVQQKFALELLLDKDISLVTLIGVPGSGKTLLALAAGLEQVFESKTHRRLLISRPVVPVGRDIGFLPGTKEEKLSTWMGAVKDNIEFLCDQSGQVTPDEMMTDASDIFSSDKIEVEAVAFLRGRSLPKMYIIIDDAQNLTPHEVKTIISRAGEGTKVVLTGDPYQIDNPYLDAASNGLSNLVERFKGQKVSGTVKFDKIERSGLAALASELL